MRVKESVAQKMAPKMIPVASSTIEAIGHDHARRELHIRFRRPPTTYVYCPVDATLFEEFLRAPSKGDYFNEKVKEKYIYRPLDEEVS